MEDYLSGAFLQLIDRARDLTTLVSGADYPSSHDGLRQICSERLRIALKELRQLKDENIVLPELQSPRRLRRLRQIVQNLDDIEMIGVTALSVVAEDTSRSNKIVHEVCNQIGYPLVAPTVANLATSYFGIHAEFNLLMVPLLEDRYLLHLPDLYHELAHPLLHEIHIDNTDLDAFRDAFKNSLLATIKHTGELTQTARRERSAAALPDYFYNWQKCWVRTWLNELFCDLFAVVTVGPAYGWSHLHLSAKRGGNPFDLPLHSVSSHPPDDVRMRVILLALEELGFGEQANQISNRWTELSALSDCNPSPEYRMCFPESLLKVFVKEVRQGVNAIGVNEIRPGVETPWAKHLNDAWDKFWDDHVEYRTWEQGLLKQLQLS